MEKIYIVNDLVKKDYILKNKDEKVLMIIIKIMK